MNQVGANIQYPYHELPLLSTEDRIGFWAMFGIYEEIVEEMNDGDDDTPKSKKEIDCGSKRKDEK